jgi:hypothetical protein
MEKKIRLPFSIITAVEKTKAGAFFSNAISLGTGTMLFKR